MSLGTAIKRWQSNWMRAQELDSLDQDQRNALARDIEVATDMLPVLVVRDPEAAAELPRLMNALSLDSDRIRHIHATLMRDMSLTCSGLHGGSPLSERSRSRAGASSLWRILPQCRDPEGAARRERLKADARLRSRGKPRPPQVYQRRDQGILLA